jgi:predicted phosphodiesterase
MRIAIFSDVHGFDHALRTVLDDLDRHGPFDEIVAAGDHCELGPGPADALDLLLSRGVTLLLGNTDLAIVEGAEAETDVPELRYAIARLGPERIAILAALPFSRRITPPGGSGPNDDLLIVHATPHSLVDRFQPDWSDDRLRQIVGPARARVIVFGHHHVCFVRRLDGLMLVDVSAVGNPKDGDLRSTYGIFTWIEAERRWDVVLRKVEYPLEATEEQIRSSPMPDADEVIRELRRSSYRD